MAPIPLEITSADGGRFPGFLSLPPGGNGPGLVLLPDGFGVNRPMRGAADFFAEEGHVVFVPDLLWRLQRHVDFDRDAVGAQKAQELSARFNVLPALPGHVELTLLLIR
jgi:carboxymethylenebutenolidase